jgi:hypothetical protein
MKAPQATFRGWRAATTSLSGHERRELFESLPNSWQGDAWTVLRQQVEGRRLLDGEIDFAELAPIGAAAQTLRQRNGSAGIGRSGHDDPLLEIPPPAYFEVLVGEFVPERGGMIRCPLPGHEDREPSCRVYGEPERGWTCFGCGRGGSIYDLAAAVTTLGTRGEDFNRLREWIAQRFLNAPLEAAA